MRKPVSKKARPTGSATLKPAGKPRAKTLKPSAKPKAKAPAKGGAPKFGTPEFRARYGPKPKAKTKP